MTIYCNMRRAAVLVALLPSAAMAQVTPGNGKTVNAATAVAPFGASSALTNDGLSTVRGEANLDQVVTAQNNGVVSGNTVTGNSQTGTIHFDSNSFANLNGLSLLSANTGNNVSINSSLNVNVAITR